MDGEPNVLGTERLPYSAVLETYTQDAQVAESASIAVIGTRRERSGYIPELSFSTKKLPHRWGTGREPSFRRKRPKSG